MLELLTILSLCSLIFFLARRIVRKRRGAQAPARARTGVEAWVAAEVAGIVARKLAMAKDDVTRAMGGDPDAEVVSAVERVVAGVELVYEKLAAGQIELRAVVSFEDGTSQRATRMIGWSELPADVRDEMSRSGASQLHRAWAMPWAE